MCMKLNKTKIMSNKPTPQYQRFGQLLTKLRHKAEIPQQSDLATRIGVTQQTISRWEAGLSRPRSKQLTLLIQALSIEATITEDDIKMLIDKYQPNETTVTQAFDKPLPTNELNEYIFQRFCTDFLSELYRKEGATVYDYGSRGHCQHGIDSEALFPDGKVYTFQYKQVKSFGPAKVSDVVAKHTKNSNKKFILLSRTASPEARERIKQHQDWSIWDQEDISRRFRSELSRDQQHILVDRYFKGAEYALLGESETNPWQTGEKFFAPFIADRNSLFNHAWKLIGRTGEVNEAINCLSDNNKHIIFLTGTGGSGKSRILKEIIDQYTDKRPSTIIRLLSQNETATQKSLTDLGDSNKILIVDDAHRQTDLNALFGYAATQDNVKLILALRPYSLDFLKQQASCHGFSESAICEIKLTTLTMQQSTELALQALKKHNGPTQLAKTIAKFTYDCPLATVISAIITSKEKYNRPEFAKNNADFRHIILGKFHDIITGNIGQIGDQQYVKKLLRIIALIQPLDANSTIITQLAKQQESISEADTKRLIKSMINVGILFNRSNKYRLSPDTLADYIIEDTCIGSHNTSTGYVEDLFDIADAIGTPDLIQNILLNIAQVDWRLSSGEQTNSWLMTTLWQKLHPHTKHIKAVSAIAPYQPKQALNFAEQCMNEPSVLMSLPELIKNTTYSKDCLLRACQLLWELNKHVKKPIQNPGLHSFHPIQTLGQLCSIERGKPIDYIEGCVDCTLTLLEKHDAWDHLYSPLDALKNTLEPNGISVEFSNHKATINPFLVLAKHIKPIRQKIINAILGLLTHKKLKVAIQASELLQRTLRYPTPTHGLEITETEKDAWTLEFKSTLEKIEQIIQNNQLDPLVLIEIVKSIHWHAYYAHNPTTSNIASRIVNRLPKTLEFRTLLTLCDSQGYLHPHKRSLSDPWPWGDTKRSLEECEQYLQTLATDLINTQPSSAKLCSILENHLQHIHNNHKAGALANNATHKLYTHIVNQSTSFADAIIKFSLKHPDSNTTNYLDIALAKVMKADTAHGREIINYILNTKQQKLETAAALAYARLSADNIDYNETDFIILQRMLSSTNKQTISSTIYAIGNLATSTPHQVIALLKQISFSSQDDKTFNAADKVCSILLEGHSRLVQTLTEQDIDELLTKLIPLPELKGHDIENFLAYISEQYAGLAMQFFMARTEFAIQTTDYYQPCNIGPFHDTPLRFRQAKDFQRILKTTWYWMLTHEQSNIFIFQHRAAELFSAMFKPFDAEIVHFFSSRLATTQADELHLICQILSEASSSFVFKHLEFVHHLLNKAQAFDIETSNHARTALLQATMSGEKSGPIGQPFKNDIEIKASAEEVLKHLSSTEPAYRLYSEIKEYAEREIQHAIEQGKELEDVF